MAKVRIAASSVRLLEEMHRHVVSCNLRGPISRFKDIAADPFDGAYFRDELDDLIRRRLLTVIHYGFDDSRGRDPNRDRDPRLCGSEWSVNPTERLLLALWPDRIEPEPS